MGVGSSRLDRCRRTLSSWARKGSHRSAQQRPGRGPSDARRVQPRHHNPRQQAEIRKPLHSAQQARRPRGQPAAGARLRARGGGGAWSVQLQGRCSRRLQAAAVVPARPARNASPASPARIFDPPWWPRTSPQCPGSRGTRRPPQRQARRLQGNDVDINSGRRKGEAGRRHAPRSAQSTSGAACCCRRGCRAQAQAQAAACLSAQLRAHRGRAAGRRQWSSGCTRSTGRWG